MFKYDVLVTVFTKEPEMAQLRYVLEEEPECEKALQMFSDTIKEILISGGRIRSLHENSVHIYFPNVAPKKNYKEYDGPIAVVELKAVHYS